MRPRIYFTLSVQVVLVLGLFEALCRADKNPFENLVTALEKADLGPDVYAKFKDFLTRYPFSNGSDPNSERSKRIRHHFKIDKKGDKKVGKRYVGEGEFGARMGPERRRGSHRFVELAIPLVLGILSLFAPQPPPPVTNIIQEFHNTFNTNANRKCECNCNTICAQPACPMLPANPKECAYFPVCDSRCDLVVDEKPATTSTTTSTSTTTTTSKPTSSSTTRRPDQTAGSGSTSTSQPSLRSGRYALLLLLLDDPTQFGAGSGTKTTARPADGNKYKLLTLILNDPNAAPATGKRSHKSKNRSFQEIQKQVGAANQGILYLHNRVEQMSPKDGRVRDDIISLVQLNHSRLNEVDTNMVNNMKYIIEYYKDRVPNNMPDTNSQNWPEERRKKTGAILTAGLSVMGHAVHLGLAADKDGQKVGSTTNFNLDMSCNCNSTCYGSIDRCELVCPSNHNGCSTSRCDCSQRKKSG